MDLLQTTQSLCKCLLQSHANYHSHKHTLYLFSNFWQIVREYSEEEKKQLLAFITGSDRIPVGGLAKLKLVIVKNGPDSNRQVQLIISQCIYYYP